MDEEEQGTPAEEQLDFSKDEVEITTSQVLYFNKSEPVGCKKITVRNCCVEIHDLDMSGILVVCESQVSIFDSHIHDLHDNQDYLLSAENTSEVRAFRCTFDNSKRFGIAVDKYSLLEFNECTLANVNIAGILLSCYSILKAHRSTFGDVEIGDGILVGEHCSAKITGCNFHGEKKHALTIRSADMVSIDDTTIEDCTLSSLFVVNCDHFLLSNSVIRNCAHTSIYADHVKGVIRDTVISDSEGNGINISHNSSCLVKKCRITNTTFPPIAICERSFAQVKKCDISKTEMSGIIVRGNSKASIVKTVISDIKLIGIAVSDSRGVEIIDSLIMNTENMGIACYNNSSACARSSFFVNGRIGVNSFTGGCITIKDCSLLGMQQHAVYLHRAGSGYLKKVVASVDPVPNDTDIVSFVQKINLKDRRDDVVSEEVFKIETKRCFIATDCNIVGYGPIELYENLDAENAPSGRNSTPGKCKVCNKVTTDSHFDRCGHIVYCRECWNALETKPDMCELCLMPVSAIVAPVSCSYEDEDGICSICVTNECDSVMLPCGHTICSECSVQCLENNPDCPFCREKNVRAQKYVSYE